MAAPKWSNVTVTLGELVPWAANPKFSTKAQAKRLIDSWHKFGQVMTVAIGPGKDVYDGHQRLSALLTIHGPDYAIDARQSDRPLTDAERRELVVTLHAGAVGSWDWDSLANWDAPALMDWGLNAEALAGLKKDISALGNMIDSENPPTLEPVGIEEQGRLDQKNPVTCPECGHEFVPTA